MMSSAQEALERELAFTGGARWATVRAALAEFNAANCRLLQRITEDLGYTRGREDPPMPLPAWYYRSPMR